MPSVLDYYGQYNPQSTMDWDGFKSSKFGRTRRHFQPRDTIRSSLDIPQSENKSGRKHYEQKLSPERQFRTSLRKVEWSQHWHPKESSKKIVQMTISQPHPRRQRRHLSPLSFQSDNHAGLRTFYNLGLKSDMPEYSVEDRMQRKTRVDLHELRRSYFQNQSCSMMLNTSRR